MLYVKRMLFLLSLVGLSAIANSIRPEVNNQFSLGTIGFVAVNILFVMTIIFAYNFSKSIFRSLAIVIAETMILIILIITTLLPGFHKLYSANQFLLIITKSSFIPYIHMILGYCLISFINILKNKNHRRSGLGNSVRYMR